MASDCWLFAPLIVRLDHYGFDVHHSRSPVWWLSTEAIWRPLHNVLSPADEWSLLSLLSRAAVLSLSLSESIYRTLQPVSLSLSVWVDLPKSPASVSITMPEFTARCTKGCVLVLPTWQVSDRLPWTPHRLSPLLFTFWSIFRRHQRAAPSPLI